ncbi:MAG: ABC transporter permease [Oscillospiraceae bacterium]
MNKEKTLKGTSAFSVFMKKNAAIIGALILFCVVLSFMSENFLTEGNIMSLLRQVSTNAFLTLGMMLCIIIGGIDIGLGAYVALSGTVTAVCITNIGMPIPIAIILGILSCVLCGLTNGMLIAYIQVPAFIATMAIMNVARGAAYLATNAEPVRVTSTAYSQIGIGRLWVIPYPVIYTIIAIIVMALFMNKTRMGRYIYSVGGNIEAARYSGINIKAVQISVHCISGFMAGIAGIILSARMYSGQPAVAQGYELDAVAASVLGGISLTGGSGSVISAMIGVLIIGVLQNGLALMNVNSFWQLIAKGVVILIAVSIDMLRQRKK